MSTAQDSVDEQLSMVVVPGQHTVSEWHGQNAVNNDFHRRAEVLLASMEMQNRKVQQISSDVHEIRSEIQQLRGQLNDNCGKYANLFVTEEQRLVSAVWLIDRLPVCRRRLPVFSHTSKLRTPPLPSPALCCSDDGAAARALRRG